MPRSFKSEPMPEQIHSRANVVVVELGAPWPAALVGRDAGRPAGSTCRVLSEVEGEGPLAFAARVEDFVAQAVPRGTEVALAVVACNQRADETAEVARRALCECLLARVTKGGTLFFSAADATSERFRRRLLDLVGDFTASGAPVARVQAYFAEEASRTTSGPAASDSTSLSGTSVARVA
jgi:hypothetical protein